MEDYSSKLLTSAALGTLSACGGNGTALGEGQSCTVDCMDGTIRTGGDDTLRAYTCSNGQLLAPNITCGKGVCSSLFLSVSVFFLSLALYFLDCMEGTIRTGGDDTLRAYTCSNGQLLAPNITCGKGVCSLSV